jgi:hypothetical protein
MIAPRLGVAYRANGHARQKAMRLATDEFIRRFLNGGDACPTHGSLQ